MTKLEKLVNILVSTKPPKPLLKYMDDGKITPMYMFDAITRLNNGKYHNGVRINDTLLSTNIHEISQIN